MTVAGQWRVRCGVSNSLDSGIIIGTGGAGYTIPFEANSLLHEHYSLGMARSQDLDSGGSQWYICLNALPELDGNYVVFGKVASGESVVDALRRGDKITRAVVIPASP